MDFQISPGLSLLTVILVAFVARGVLSGRGVFEFPTIAAMLGVAWVLPQAIEVERAAYVRDGSDAFWLYVSLCFLLLEAGFVFGVSRSKENIAVRYRRAGDSLGPRSFNDQRLVVAAGAMTLFGLINHTLMGGVDTSQMEGGWTGVITMYALFSGATSFGLCLSMLVFARTGSRLALCIAIVSAAPIVQIVLAGVRRELLFDLVLLSAGSFYLARKVTPPRVAVIACLLLGTVVLNKVGELRSYVESGQGSFVDLLMSEKFYTEFNYFGMEQGGASEVGLARSDFMRLSQTDELEYGAGYWNSLVSQYVPAFLVGREFKGSLMFPTLDRRADAENPDIAFSMGSTRTGFSDTFRSFSWFGAVVFGIIGYIFGRLYAWALTGGIQEQFYYLVFLGGGLKAITHSTAEFFSSLPFAIAIAAMAFAFARVRRSNSADDFARRAVSTDGKPVRAQRFKSGL